MDEKIINKEDVINALGTPTSVNEEPSEFEDALTPAIRLSGAYVAMWRNLEGDNILESLSYYIVAELAAQYIESGIDRNIVIEHNYISQIDFFNFDSFWFYPSPLFGSKKYSRTFCYDKNDKLIGIKNYSFL